jgi:hypothetical protein
MNIAVWTSERPAGKLNQMMRQAKYSPVCTGKRCPKCRGTTGFSYEMTETHSFFAGWGGEAAIGDSGLDVCFSYAKCADCGERFSVKSLVKKELLTAPRGAR